MSENNKIIYCQSPEKYYNSDLSANEYFKTEQIKIEHPILPEGLSTLEENNISPSSSPSTDTSSKLSEGFSETSDRYVYYHNKCKKVKTVEECLNDTKLPNYKYNKFYESIYFKVPDKETDYTNM